jgi:rhodanese-related sulfurtransferase
MPRRADTDTVRDLVTAGAQLLEVLPASEYGEEHLPGAVNIPLPKLTGESVAAHGLDRGRPTVVYCYDHECDLSSRGAALLEALGFEDVYDYTASKTAWLGEGLPVDGTIRASQRAGALARPLQSVAFDAVVADARERFGEDGLCAIVDAEGVVLGVLRDDVLALDDATPVHSVMQPGPPSVRPSITARDLAESMDKDGRRYVIVTTSHGRLLGIVTTTDLHGQH